MEPLKDRASLMTNYFHKKDVKSAVEWLKRALPSMPIHLHIECCGAIDEAFEDVRDG